MSNKDQLSPSGNMTLSPLGTSAHRASFLTVTPFQEQSRRTIETEFGTIVVDGNQLVVQPDNINIPTTPKSTATLLKPSELHPHESALGTTLSKSPSEKLAMTLQFEQNRRQESGMWVSDCEMMAIVLSSFMAFRCVIHGPRIWMEFSGGSYILAFAICNLVITLPLLLLEVALGQFTGHGVAAFMPQMAPALRGYPNALLFCLIVKGISWAGFLNTVSMYVVEALQLRPCWMGCNESFNTELCYTDLLDRGCHNRGALLFAAGRCVSREELCQLTNNSTADQSSQLEKLATACISSGNGSVRLNRSALLQMRTLAAAEYFYDVKTKKDGDRIHAHGNEIVSLLCCWMLITLISQGGFEFVGYTLPLLLGLPACISAALIVNEVMTGRDFFALFKHFLPKVEHLSDYKCWLFAASSSLIAPNIGVGYNSLIYSRNPPKHNCQRSVLIVVAITFTVNTFWPLFITSIMSKNARATGRGLNELLGDHSDDPDLIMLTSLLGMTGETRLWLALLLLVAFLLVLGSIQVGVLAVEATLREMALLTTISTRAAVCLICTAGFVADALFSMLPNSVQLNAAISVYVDSYFDIVLALVMVCAVNVTLGVDTLLDELTRQLGLPLERCRWFWSLCWRCLSPLMLLGMFASTIWHQATHPLGFRGETLPAWMAVVAAGLAVTPLLLVVVEVFRAYAEVDSGDGEELYRPTERWRMGLLTREMLAAAGLADSEDGGGREDTHAARSIMTRVYGAVSSRWLFPKGSMARVDSMVAPADAGSGVLQTRPEPRDGGPGGHEPEGKLQDQDSKESGSSTA